jgi:hypothetical protein
MRKSYVLIGVLLLSLSLFIGCSDNSTEPALTEGDYNDPSYQQAQPMVDSLVVATFENLGESFNEYLYFDGNTPASVADTAYLVYDEETCWWHIYVSIDSAENHIIVSDSVWFSSVEACQQFPDSLTTNELDVRAYVDLYLTEDTTTISSDAYRNFHAVGLQNDIVTLNASESNESSIVNGLSSVSIDYEGSLIDLTFLRGDVYEEATDPYPLSGTLTMSMLLTVETPENSMTISWSVTITFGPDGYHARAESGDNYWEWDGTYDG